MNKAVKVIYEKHTSEIVGMRLSMLYMEKTYPEFKGCRIMAADELCDMRYKWDYFIVTLDCHHNKSVNVKTTTDKNITTSNFTLPDNINIPDELPDYFLFVDKRLDHFGIYYVDKVYIQHLLYDGNWLKPKYVGNKMYYLISKDLIQQYFHSIEEITDNNQYIINAMKYLISNGFEEYTKMYYNDAFAFLSRRILNPDETHFLPYIARLCSDNPNTLEFESKVRTICFTLGNFTDAKNELLKLNYF